jgi:hypothetical protein
MPQPGTYRGAMTRSVTGFLMLGAAVTGVWAGYAAARRRVLDRAQVLALMALQLLVVIQGFVSLGTLALGHDAAEAGTHVAYLVGALAVLPVLVGVPVRLGFPPEPGAPGSPPVFLGGIDVSPPEQRDAASADRWRPVLAAVGCVTILVMLERMWVTWQP